MSGHNNNIQQQVKAKIAERGIDYKQKRSDLASIAENSLPAYASVSAKARNYLDQGVICDLFEGAAPYRARYILPDYQKFLRQGCNYLNLPPAHDIHSAINYLQILYHYVPSIIDHPVYLGSIDELLSPWEKSVSRDELKRVLKYFIMHINRTFPSAFVHMNLGPKDSLTSRLWLELEGELELAIPNLSFKYHRGVTPDDLLELALTTAMKASKPYIVDDEKIASMWKELAGEGESKREEEVEYGVASCYNTLRIGGGSHTLVRLNLREAATKSSMKAGDITLFLEEVVPEAVAALAEIINYRASFLVEESGFFANSFLAREGLIDLKKFTSMGGVVGLHECVEILSGGGRMGWQENAKDRLATDYAETIIQTIASKLSLHPGKYCDGSNGKITLHAQSGIDTDLGTTAGVRIQIGKEPTLFAQMNLAARLQKYFTSGVSDIYVFEPGAKDNLQGLASIVKKGIDKGIRILSINNSSSDCVRVTGYLVKKSEVERYWKKESLRDESLRFGAPTLKNANILGRKVRSTKENKEDNE
ncbi:MAG: YjjI family glycine radical enzyme [Oligoflexia bacterium]|nr:YjjI family glycine radical enzyme [Oligoflexia bacterium]MBF0364670.1 YjjI family glycine radical enzyme [Oligoflexia bacterium]